MQNSRQTHVVASYERKLSDQNKKHLEELNEIKQNSIEERAVLNLEYEKYKKNLFESDLKKYIKQITPIYYIVSIMIMGALFAATILQLIFQQNWDVKSIIGVVSSLILFLVDLIQLIIQITKKSILNWLIEKRTNKLSAKYNIN